MCGFDKNLLNYCWIKSKQSIHPITHSPVVVEIQVPCKCCLLKENLFENISVADVKYL